MYNITTSNSAGYNGVSQIPDARCTPPYDNADSSPGDKLRAYLHNEVQTGVVLPGDRKIIKSKRQSSTVNKTHQLIADDVYTFKDSELQYSHNIHSNNSRLRSPINRKSEELNKNISETTTKANMKQIINGFNNSFSNNVIQNGVHSDSNVKNNLFSNFAMGGDERKFSENNTTNYNSCMDTKHSIIKYNNHFIESNIGTNSDNKVNKIKDEVVDNSIKTEPASWSVEGRVTAPLFSSSYKLPPSTTNTPSRKTSLSGKPSTASPRSRRGRGPALHEALQRITTHNTFSTALTSSIKPSTAMTSSWVSPSTPLFDCSSLDAKHEDTSYNNYIQPWLEGVSGCEPGMGRAERLAARRATLRRRTTQLTRYSQTLHASYSLHQTIKNQFEKLSAVDNNDAQCLPQPTLDRILAARGYTTLLTAVDRKKIKGCSKLLGGGECVIADCSSTAMACTAYCSRHISNCRDQRLFASCTAKFSDNTQCKMPVINITNHLPLCDEHAWKRDNYNKISQELKPKKAPRKRPKPSAMIRPQKRNRKRKKAVQPTITSSNNSGTTNTTSTTATLSALPSTQGSTSSGCEESAEEAGMGLTEEFIEAANNHNIVDEEVVAQVLGLHVEETRAPSQDGNIDLSAVLNDFFAAEQNEEYVPTREETEELERALEAVNQDVKSLEKLTASQGSGGNLLLDTFLDERALAETLASLPDVFSPSPNCTA